MIPACKIHKIVLIFLLLLHLNAMASTPPKILDCLDFIDTSLIEFTKINCDTDAKICLNITLGNFLNYTLTDNGQPYSGGASVCDFDTSFAYTYFMLPGNGMSGPYMVDSWIINGNLFSGQVADMAALADSMNVWDPLGNWVLDGASSSIRGGSTAMYYESMIVTQISSGISTTLNLTLSLNPQGTLITLGIGYHELIFTEPVEGCQDTLIIDINCTPCPEIYTGNLNLMAESCDSSTAVCFEIPKDELTKYAIFHNNGPFWGIITECSDDATFFYDYSTIPSQGASGPYHLQNWMVNGSAFNGDFNNITELVIAMNIWDPAGNWILNAGNQTISGGVGSNDYSDIQILQILSGLSGTAAVQTIPSATSIELSFQTGNHQLIFYNLQNLCLDTFSLFIDCIPCPEIFNGQPVVAETDQCDEAAGVCLPVPFVNISDYSVTVNGLPYNGAFQNCQDDSTMILLDTGFYSIVLTHLTTGCKDSVEVTVNCIPDTGCDDFLDIETVFLNVENCSDLAELCVNLLVSNIDEYSVFDNGMLLENGVGACSSDNSMASVSLDFGFHQLIFQHDLTGCRDTIEAVVACISTDSVEIDVFVNESGIFCIDTTELVGAVINIENICTDASGEFVLFDLDSENYCVAYSGVEEGVESACLVVCDDMGYCDTTFLTITVQNITPLPNAVDDFGTTERNTPLTIKVLPNDEINGIYISLLLKTNPANGIAYINNDRSITYSPDPGFCDETVPETFDYELCNVNGCDTATVSVLVNCGGVKVYNGFSPNNDGINDSFVIDGALESPGNKLSVYNRWGLLVFQTDNYQNDWQGTWQNTQLTEGTYFYLFDDGKGNRHTGYVQIHR